MNIIQTIKRKFTSGAIDFNQTPEKNNTSDLNPVKAVTNIMHSLAQEMNDISKAICEKNTSQQDIKNKQNVLKNYQILLKKSAVVREKELKKQGKQHKKVLKSSSKQFERHDKLTDVELMGKQRKIKGSAKPSIPDFQTLHAKFNPAPEHNRHFGKMDNDSILELNDESSVGSNKTFSTASLTDESTNDNPQ